MRVLNPWIFGAVVALSGCSLSLEFDCTEDTDCDNLTGTYVCSGGACVETAPDTALDMEMLPDMTPEPEGFTCEDDEPLINDGCADLYGPLAGVEGATSEQRMAALMERPEDFELIAIQVPNGPVVNTGQDRIRAAIHHAIDHINTSGGFTFGEGLQQSRKLAALVCVDALSDGSVAGGIESANHAIGCGAKALVSTYVSGLTVDIFREVALPNDVPMIAPGAISPQIPVTREALGDDGLLWRIKVPGRTLLRSVVGLINELDYQNVHIFYRPTTLYDQAMFDLLELSLGEERTTPFEMEGTAGARAQAVTEYLVGLSPAARPDLVVTVVEDLNDLVDVALGVIAAAADEPALLFDLMTVEGARSAQAAAVVASQPDFLPMACRAMGINSGSTNGGATDFWQQRLSLAAETYGLTAADVDTGLPAPTSAYVDGVFVTAYALASALRRGSGQATTDGIIDGLKVLSDTNGEEILPLQWSVGLRALGDAGTNQINYNGASGSIDLDDASQDATGRKTEIWQYNFDTVPEVRELGDLVLDGANDSTPSPDAIEALRSSAQDREMCAEYPYAGLAGGGM